MIYHLIHIKILFLMYINMNNIYLFISLLCIIFLNCFWRAYITKRREGFDIGKIGKEIGKFTDFIKNFDPGKLIDEGLGKIIDSILGSVPILKDIHKKVKKKKGLSINSKQPFLNFSFHCLQLYSYHLVHLPACIYHINYF